MTIVRDPFLVVADEHRWNSGGNVGPRSSCVQAGRSKNQRHDPEAAASALSARLRRGVIAHTHIVPAFARRVDAFPGTTTTAPSDQGTDGGGEKVSPSHKSGAAPLQPPPHQPFQPKRPTGGCGDDGTPLPWIKDLAGAALDDYPAAATTPPRPPPRRFPIRIEIHPPPAPSLPPARQPSSSPAAAAETRPHAPPLRYTLCLKAPLEDAFFHWTFSCHAYSVRTAAARMGWDDRWWCAAAAGEGEGGGRRRGGGADAAAAVREFVEVVKDVVRLCLNEPNRFVVAVERQDRDESASLRVWEIVKGYRKVSILDLEFAPSPWSDVTRDIREDFVRTQAHYKQLRSALVESLSVVMRKHPSLLLTGGVPDPLQPTVTRPWAQLVQDLLPPSPQKTAEAVRRGRGKWMSESERIMRKKLFVLATGPADDSLEVAFVKSIGVRVSGLEESEVGNCVRRLRFTIFAKGPRPEQPDSYLVTITSDTDVFCSFVSVPITPSEFQRMTQTLELVRLDGEYKLSPDLRDQPAPVNGRRRASSSESSSSAPAAAASVATEGAGRARVLGFHGANAAAPAGGLVGVLGWDLLHGCEADPDRFACALHVRRARTARGPAAASASHAAETGRPPQLRRARLAFYEKVVHRSKELLRIHFVEASREYVKRTVQERFAQLKKEIDWTQHRLDTLYDAVRRKSPSLLVELGGIELPQSWTSSRTRWRARAAANQPLHLGRRRRGDGDGEIDDDDDGDSRGVIAGDERVHGEDDYDGGRAVGGDEGVAVPVLPPPTAEPRTHSGTFRGRPALFAPRYPVLLQPSDDDDAGNSVVDDLDGGGDRGGGRRAGNGARRERRWMGPPPAAGGSVTAALEKKHVVKYLAGLPSGVAVLETASADSALRFCETLAPSDEHTSQTNH
ncbi:hypothetical protein DFJ73DRAFT_967228 [Zopfochytrium polystomum]|nr:hypothetical protein DFJ73DRAFT_967228 [Zopfochytrium polystomum]